MKKILIIGSGAMGAAFSIPLIENRHHVTLSEPHNIKLISKLNLKKKFHHTKKYFETIFESIWFFYTPNSFSLM